MNAHRFKCPCGKVNKFTVSDGPARSVKVRCGACKQVCRMDVPEHSEKTRAAEAIDSLGLREFMDRVMSKSV